MPLKITPPAELDEELNTVGVCELGGTAEGFTAGAHSKHDPLTGELAPARSAGLAGHEASVLPFLSLAGLLQ